ncbi:MAG: acylphosphatase [archaeon]|nr:acylphosphatase [archaeon]
MKKSVKLTITGSVQSMFFRTYIKEKADINNVRGFLRKLEDGRLEIFLEGNKEDVNEMISVCKNGPKHSIIRNIEEKETSFQDFKEFKIFNFI